MDYSRLSANMGASSFSHSYAYMPLPLSSGRVCFPSPWILSLSCDFIWLIECDWSDWLSSQPSLYKALCLPLSFSPVEASCHVRQPRIGCWIMRDYVKRKRWWEGEVAISANTWYQDFNLGMLVKPSWTFWPYLNHSSWHHVEMRGDLPPLNTPQISDSKVIWLVF